MLTSLKCILLICRWVISLKNPEKYVQPENEVGNQNKSLARLFAIRMEHAQIADIKLCLDSCKCSSLVLYLGQLLTKFLKRVGYENFLYKGCLDKNLKRVVKIKRVGSKPHCIQCFHFNLDNI